MKVLLTALLSLMILASKAQAGFLFTSGLLANNFSFSPEEEERTPNYYGLGASLSLGYSFFQAWDFALLGWYSQGAQSKLVPSKSDVLHYFYGGEMAFRIKNSVYLAFRGGLATYDLKEVSGDPDEVEGLWTGTGAGLALGGLIPFSKSSFMQLSLDLMQTVVERSDQDVVVSSEVQERTLDTIMFNISYVYNGRSRSSLEGTIFKDFLDTVVFW